MYLHTYVYVLMITEEWPQVSPASLVYTRLPRSYFCSYAPTYFHTEFLPAALPEGGIELNRRRLAWKTEW